MYVVVVVVVVVDTILVAVFVYKHFSRNMRFPTM